MASTSTSRSRPRSISPKRDRSNSRSRTRSSSEKDIKRDKSRSPSPSRRDDLIKSKKSRSQSPSRNRSRSVSPITERPNSPSGKREKSRSPSPRSPSREQKRSELYNKILVDLKWVMRGRMRYLNIIIYNTKPVLSSLYDKDIISEANPTIFPNAIYNHSLMIRKIGTVPNTSPPQYKVYISMYVQPTNPITGKKLINIQVLGEKRVTLSISDLNTMIASSFPQFDTLSVSRETDE